MEKIRFDYNLALRFVKQGNIDSWAERIAFCHEMLHAGTGPGSECRGWLDWPISISADEVGQIKAAASRIRQEAQAFLVVGIGGSYLGTRAAIEMLTHSFRNELPPDRRQGPRIYFAGYQLSSAHISHLLEVIDGPQISLNVISKSGTTTEPALIFGLLKAFMEEKYGPDEARRRIFATTDKERGLLRELADREGYTAFTIPDDIGGRYSVLTPVGLLPMAVAGIDIEEVLKGARAAAQDLQDPRLMENPCYQYAAVRNILYGQGYSIELLAAYEPGMHYLGEWFKQLFGESEGKSCQGIFPAAVSFTTDLHSLGQYIQEGPRNLFETVLRVKKASTKVQIDWDTAPPYLKGHTLDFVNQKALEGALLAHSEGGVPCLQIEIPEISPYYFGYLVYFFMKACAISGYLAGVNPFDQPGVEAYKRHMQDLLK
ncbi:MAG: glucose-6-phosphate isomerase [Syntrophomonadaceae bacterium]|nr:glucose-6-phosphate isomerase [Syntrophomonadaceae bacterium]